MAARTKGDRKQESNKEALKSINLTEPLVESQRSLQCSNKALKPEAKGRPESQRRMSRTVSGLDLEGDGTGEGKGKGKENIFL
ncbi:hypothetical protein X943_002578 [Babesia divergens]|uniref:Uncharacterized protein n=1 Tax=Babesia divergens TaxID=32595 RepID=A0AAD9LDB4_BABDI|nr:hypothetical protein X943_002578 [Babesia divergens]